MRSSHSVPDPAAHGVREEGKKRYPTAEEIKVIGGYQSLDKSCLAKGRGTQKGVKVCFDEVQLEVVFEYPSESSLLASFPCPPLPCTDRGREEEDEEDEEEEKGVFLFMNSRCEAVGPGRVLRVDESCHQ
ncbi:phostensin-like [Megalops cyprinoides]|uniref:phostensin-like n=1 Tax=Megalops cyprinoides TaxID=118141 RepID=UPI0018646719|nr:phostensin-like [Megalops cyprinoides]